jgi:CubicO group peptidase (beta-lactamase class C family)
MKTRVIQNEPEGLPTGGARIVSAQVAGPGLSNNPAARLRRWTAQHRKPAIGGAALVVLLAVSIAVVATKSDSVAGSPVTPTTGANGRPDFAAIDRYVQREIDAQRIPGLALAVVEGDRIVHVRGFGKADESGRKVTPQTLFFNGSTTKSFTALAIMQLREAGKVDLDAPVQRYLPWWRVADADASRRVTVRHLLYQVSGLSKATGNAHATSADASASALEDQVRELRSAKLTKPVGTTWQYSNANYNILGMIVQTVSGQPYEMYVRQHILEPLGMRNSVMSVTEAKKRGLVTGYRYWFGFPRAADLPFNRGNLPAGGLISSVEDMAHYLSAEVNGGRHGSKTVISTAGMTELQRAGVPTGHAGVAYAMGWEVRETNGIPTLSHDGSMFNAHSNVVLIPEGKWGIILMENAENSPDDWFGARRMSGIADGVTNMVKGRQPGSTGSNTTLWIVFGVVFGIIGLQITGIVRTVRKFRRWRTATSRRPHGFLRVGLSLGPLFVLSLIWSFLVLIAVPLKVGAPLSALLMGMPDLGYLLLGSVIVALGWGIAKVIWAGLVLHSRAAV